MDDEAQEVTSNIENVDETLVEMEEGEEDEEEEEEEKEEEEEEHRPLRDDGASPDYEVPGVERVVLDEDIQSNLGIVVGIDVTGERPWKKISKELIMDNLTSMGSNSPFAPLKKQIIKYEDDEILVGYLLDETNDFDEFYVCLTQPAKEYCETVSEEFLQRQAQRLDESVVKQCGRWRGLGTEAELNETLVKYSRPLLRVEITSRFPLLEQTDRFVSRNANDVRDGYIELIPVKEVKDNLFKKRIDAQIQVTPKMLTASAQTVPRFPRNIWTQTSGDDTNMMKKETDDNDKDEPPVELTDSEKYKRDMAAKAAERERELTVLRFRDFLFDKVPKVERIMNFISSVDIYNLDYPSLVENEEYCKVENLDLKELSIFSDKRTKNMYVASVTWHPLHTQYVAVSYVDSVPNVISDDLNQEDEVKRAIYGEFPVLVWSVFDSLRPQFYMESNSQVNALSLCIIDEDLMIGGCLNGQIVLWDTKILGEKDTTEVLTDEQESNRQTLYSGMNWMKKIHDRFVIRPAVSSNIRGGHGSTVSDIRWVSSHYEFNNFGKLQKLPPNRPRSKQFISTSEDGSLLIWDLKIADNLNAKEVVKTKQGIAIPKVLIFEKSPYKLLKGKFKPIFRVITGTIEKFSPLVCISIQFPTVNTLYERINEDGKKEMLETPWPEPEEEDNVDEGDVEKNSEPRPMISLATYYGEYMRISWGSKEINQIESVNSTLCDYVSRALFHGGVIIACVKNTFFADVIATIGGTVIAIWRGEVQDRPIAWKRMKYSLKAASWSQTVPSQIYVLADNGNIDMWDFLERSDLPVRSQTLTGTYSTGIFLHRLLEKHIMTITDMSGYVSIYSIPKPFVRCDENDKELTKRLFQRENAIRDMYMNWNNEWMANNPETLGKYKTEKKITFKDSKTEKKTKVVEEKDDHGYGFHGEEISDKLPPSLQLIAAGERMWKRMQWEGVELAIQIRKALNKAELLYYEKPLRDVESQKRSKRRKILDALENRNKIFEESLEILFPETLEKGKSHDVDKSFEEIEATRKSILTQYDNVRKKCKSILKKNPYEQTFEWDKEISFGKERCMHLDERANFFRQLSEKMKEQLENPQTNNLDKFQEILREVEELPVEEEVKPEKPPTPSPPPSPVLSDKDSDMSD